MQPESLETARTPERPLVLIIDEEESARDLYGHWFIAHGFQVMCAVGVSGLSMALRHERPQLIVTELRARDLTLHDLIARLRCDETTRCVPIIVITTSCDPGVLDNAKAAGAAAVLPKLTDFDRLGSWVSALCG
jgi:CheY-like chemotaxis protein